LCAPSLRSCDCLRIPLLRGETGLFSRMPKVPAATSGFIRDLPSRNCDRRWLSSLDSMSRCICRSCPGFDIGPRTRRSTPMGNGAVAFAAGASYFSMAACHACDDRPLCFNATAALLHAGLGGRSSSPWPYNSRLAPGPHCKHARRSRSNRDRHRLYPRIANLWVDPWTRFRQVALVLLVWGHFTMGLHFW